MTVEQEPFIPAVSARFYPDVILPDRDWDRVIKALRERGTKADDVVADKVNRWVQDARRKRVEREVDSACVALKVKVKVDDGTIE